MKSNFFHDGMKRSPVKFSIESEKLVLDSFGSQVEILIESRTSFEVLSILAYYQIHESNCMTLPVFNHFVAYSSCLYSEKLIVLKFLLHVILKANVTFAGGKLLFDPALEK